ncbi:MAG: hypothetical protein GXY77_13615 [Fibrobacter sp.]|nr:hypothetical protein [Fibrobacter sp.]
MIKAASPMCLSLLFAMVFSFEPVITVLPDSLVEVGDEVLFSANGTNGLKDPFLAFYEWDFGDGYALKRGFPFAYSAYTGANCVHYFMTPGTFTVKLFITDTDSTKDTTEKTITVTGESPAAGFELWRAPYHGRIAQYIYAQIPPSITATAGNSLRVRLIRNTKDTTTIFNKTGLSPEEPFLLQNGNLPAGEYQLFTEILNSGGNRITYIKEKFSKPYGGVPKIGINEHNAICINGEPFFPVTPWLCKKSYVPEWANRYINSCYGVGYYATNDVSTWTDYLNICSQSNMNVIGPERWDGKGPLHYEKNSDIRKIREYVNSTKDHNSMMMWMWKDEPNMGGRGEKVPNVVNAAWTGLCHLLDNQHLVAANLYGYGYLPYYNKAGDDYDYLNNAIYFGGKKHAIFDVIGFDIYPLQYTEHASLKNRRVISDYAEAIDFLQQNNYNLFPVTSFIEVQKLNNSPILPQPQQILMSAWLNVIHGIKGINWFHYFGTTPTESLNSMELFNNQIKRFAKIILGAPSSRAVTDNANEPGNRVDIMVREQGDGIDSAIYIFAVRVTEPDTGEQGYQLKEEEPEKIVVSFKIPGVYNDTVISNFDHRKIPVTNGAFQDTFNKCEVNIYHLGKDFSSNQKVKQQKKNLDEKLISFPHFKTSLMINRFNHQSLPIYSVNGKLVEKISLKKRIINPRNLKNSGVYIIKQNNGQGKRVVLIK